MNSKTLLLNTSQRYLLLKVSSLALLTLAASCSPNLARRYKNMWNKTRSVFTWVNENDVPKYANVELHSYAVEAPTVPAASNQTLLNLAGEGQSAFIKALDARVPRSTTDTDAKALIKLLTSNFPTDEPAWGKVKIIPKTLKKTLVFTTERPRFHATQLGDKPYYNFNRLADRLAYLELTVVVPETHNLHFNSWDRFVTKEITVNLGDVTSAREWNASVTANAGSTVVTGKTVSDTQAEVIGAPGTTSVADGALATNSIVNGGNKSSTLGLGAAGNVGVTNKYSTALSLTNRILALSGTLTPKRITVVQEGAQGIDLSGNQSLAIEYTTKADWASPIWVHQLPKKLYAPDGTVLPAATLKLSGFYIVFPDVPPMTDKAGKDNPAAHFMGALSYRFLYRHVIRGNSHLPEARHKAEYLFGQVGYSYERSKAQGEDGNKGDNSESKPVAANRQTEVNGQLISLTDWQNILRKGKPVELACSKDFRPITYRLQYRVPGSNPVSQHFLKFNGEIVQFESLLEAATFLRYMRDCLPMAGAPPANTFQVEGLSTNVNKSLLPNIRTERFQN